MSKSQITGFVKNSDGASMPFTGEIMVVEAPVISSVTVDPASGPAGTMRTIKIVASDPQGLPLTYECLVDGVAATKTSVPNVFTWNG